MEEYINRPIFFDVNNPVASQLRKDAREYKSRFPPPSIVKYTSGNPNSTRATMENQKNYYADVEKHNRNPRTNMRPFQRQLGKADETDRNPSSMTKTVADYGEVNHRQYLPIRTPEYYRDLHKKITVYKNHMWEYFDG